MHLCSSSVIVSLEQNLKGGSFVEVAALERHNCEEEHINPPPPSSTLSQSILQLTFLSSPSPVLSFPRFNFLL